MSEPLPSPLARLQLLYEELVVRTDGVPWINIGIVMPYHTGRGKLRRSIERCYRLTETKPCRVYEPRDEHSDPHEVRLRIFLLPFPATRAPMCCERCTVFAIITKRTKLRNECVDSLARGILASTKRVPKWLHLKPVPDSVAIIRSGLRLRLQYCNDEWQADKCTPVHAIHLGRPSCIDVFRMAIEDYNLLGTAIINNDYRWL